MMSRLVDPPACLGSMEDSLAVFVGCVLLLGGE